MFAEKFQLKMWSLERFCRQFWM